MILITGLSGRSGKWFLKKMEGDKAYFEKEGVRVLARKATSADMLSNSSLPLEVVIGDVADEHIVRQAMTNVSTVFHIVGIHTSRTIAKVAIAQGVDWLILVHTTGIYSKYKYAGETYRETERYIEQLAQGSNTRITIIRPTMIYGSVSDKNIIQFIKMVDKLKYFPVVSKAKYQLQPIHQKDLGEAYYKILKNSHITKGKNYILSGKEPIMLIDILKTIASIMNKNTVFFSVPFPIAYTAAVMIWLFTLGKIDYREKVQRLVEPRVFPHDEAIQDFGFNPMSFSEGVKPEVMEYLHHQKNPTTGST